MRKSVTDVGTKFTLNWIVMKHKTAVNKGEGRGRVGWLGRYIDIEEWEGNGLICIPSNKICEGVGRHGCRLASRLRGVSYAVFLDEELETAIQVQYPEGTFVIPEETFLVCTYRAGRGVRGAIPKHPVSDRDSRCLRSCNAPLPPALSTGLATVKKELQARAANATTIEESLIVSTLCNAGGKG